MDIYIYLFIYMCLVNIKKNIIEFFNINNKFYVYIYNICDKISGKESSTNSCEGG